MSHSRQAVSSRCLFGPQADCLASLAPLIVGHGSLVSLASKVMTDIEDVLLTKTVFERFDFDRRPQDLSGSEALCHGLIICCGFATVDNTGHGTRISLFMHCILVQIGNKFCAYGLGKAARNP